MSQTNMSTVETKLDIKNILHFFLGCEVVHKNYPNSRPIRINGVYQNGEFSAGTDEYSKSIKNYLLLLRPLSDMTEEEHKEMPNNSMHISPFGEGIFYHPKLFLYLLSKHFDLFGLIDAGLAIDKTKYKAI